MTKLYTFIYNLFTLNKAIATLTLLLLTSVFNVVALPLTQYAQDSRLSAGRWVKISVAASGMHAIPESTLRSWGFTNPTNVKIYGYGAQRVTEVLNETFIDDLPQTPSEWVDGKGLYFYADGPTSWKESTSGYFKPVQNPFTLLGYYFLSDNGDDERLTPSKSGKQANAAECVTTFYDRTFHELEQNSAGEAGFMLLGEDFKFNPTQTFNFTLTDAVKDASAKMEISFACKSSSATILEISANGTALAYTASDRIAQVTSGDKYSHGVEGITRKTFAIGNNKLAIQLSHKTSSTVSMANLNYISISYLRELTLPSTKNLTFYLTSATSDRLACLSGASDATRIWDVTNSRSINAINATEAEQKIAWESSYTNSSRTYAAWEPNGTFPKPLFVEIVANQNLHSKATPEMVIFTPGEWRSQAERLAEYHRNNAVEPLDVIVLTPQQVYNEFSSGAPDAQAFRKLLKMFYDRGNASAESKKLKYALFFSRPTYDPRCLTQKVKALKYPMLAPWCTDEGMHDNTSYNSDDIFGFLEDNSGQNLSRDQLSIAVGRIPAVSESSAKNSVDKILYYTSRAPKNSWKNTVVVLADDGDKATHMIQADSLCANMLAASVNGSDVFIKKVYIDEFNLIGGNYPDARTLLYRDLDEGAMWWTYIGHANTTSLTAEGILTFQDINNLYLRHWPVLYAATCDFLRWDSAATSGAELLFNTVNGGVIAAYSATRPVYISENGSLTKAVGNYALKRDANGKTLTIGEIYRQSKNSLTTNSNKLRYVLMGDPAMRMAMPEYRIVLDEVAGTPVTDINSDNEPATLMARQQTTVKGHVTDGLGNLVNDFHGVVNVTLYDAEKSIVTKGNSDSEKEGAEYPFQQHGERLFVGNDSIIAGHFTLNVTMPAEVADNYTPATFNLYASATDGREAAGVCRNLYVYGTDETALPDTIAPRINAIYMNHPSFVNGQKVNPSPMLLANVTDDRAINLSTSGIGHQMTLELDGGAKVLTDVANYFTPFTNGTPGGTIAYPLEDLAEGAHTLKLKVWDTAPNSAEATVNFIVAKDIAPVLYEVYTDANPASTAANFYITHDRPDRNVTVTVEVFNLMGRRVWTGSESGRSEMFTSMPLTWNLLDEGGRRVPRGIYIYRATISDADSGEKNATASRKLAVTGM